MGTKNRVPKSNTRTAGGRLIRLRVNLDQLEYDRLVEESRKAGVSGTAYVRAMILKDKLITRLEDEDKTLFKEMVSMSNVLSQLLNMAREQGLEEALLFFQAYRTGIDQLLNRIKL